MSKSNSEIKKIYLDGMNEFWLAKNIPQQDAKIYSILKRFVDLVFGCVGFVCFCLIFPFAACAIKINSRGSVFYKQQRTGKNGKVFNVSKFRSMYESNAVGWREKDLENITASGKFLRRTHIDELPQCFNLLRGELSMVGPRAEWTELSKIFEKEIPYYKYRYLVKPGIIGWAQINFPPSKSVDEAKEKFEYDLYYIKNRSFWLDLEIILKSPKLFAW